MTHKPVLWTLFGIFILVVFTFCTSTVPEEKASPEATTKAPAAQPGGTPAEAAETAAKAEPDKETPAVVKGPPEAKPPTPEAAAKEADKVPPAVKPTAPPPKVDLLRQLPQQYPAAPAEFKVRFETTKGNFVVRVVRDWSPRGVDHLHYLVNAGYYADIAVFRAIQGFMVQFGMHGNPEINGLWSNNRIQDDPVKTSNKRGFVTFAKTNLPDSRSTQLFINLVDNASLDSMGFSPIGEVVEGMEIVDSVYMEYGEGAPRGRGPSQANIAQQGNSYLKQQFPKLDYIKKAVVVK